MGCAGGLRDPGKVLSAATGHAALTYKPIFVFESKHSFSGRITRHFPLARPGGVRLRVFNNIHSMDLLNLSSVPLITVKLAGT